MEFNNFEIFASLLCSWLGRFVFGLWQSTTHITDREAGLIVALLVTVAMVAICKRVSDSNTVTHLNRHVDGVHTMAILNLREAHRKRMILVKSANDQNMPEAQNENHRITAKFNRLNGEYDYISEMYQDQTRLNSEQEDRIDYLENKLKEFGNSNSASSAPPFSAPASQVTFADPPRRAGGAVAATSPLSQQLMVQTSEVGGGGGGGGGGPRVLLSRGSAVTASGSRVRI